jgi:hypothetical protein
MEAHAGLWQPRLGPYEATVDPHLEGSLGPVSAAEPRRVVEDRSRQLMFEIVGRNLPLEHDLSSSCHRYLLMSYNLELTVEVNLPAHSALGSRSHENPVRLESEHRPEPDSKAPGGSRPSPF